MSWGLVLGKFMPPHAGHLHLISIASALCEQLTIVVGSQPSESLPGDLRYRWMQTLCPQASVLWLHRTMPQQPEEHPEFWQIWTHALVDLLGGRPDRVFAGDAYGSMLAKHLGAEFIALPRENALQISGTTIRRNPKVHWPSLPAPVRSHYACRIRVVGPESSGKTTLSRSLAEHFNATWVAEFARGYLEALQRPVLPADLPLIARGQAASEDALAQLARPLVITDTDPRLTSIWSQILFNELPQSVAAPALDRTYDLTLLMAPHEDDWQADSIRYLPSLSERRQFYALCRTAYPDALCLEGPWTQRKQLALASLEELLNG